MAAVSILIPSRNERFLQPTIRDLLAKAAGEVEVIAVLEGYWPDPALEDDPRVHVIHHGTPQGMRHAINAAAAIARGDFLLKIDAHCAVAPGYDEALKADCAEDWVVVPRRYSLDHEAWGPKSKPPIDYEFLSFPGTPDDFGGPGLHGKTWTEKNAREDLKAVLLDDQMSFQGSGWFMRRDYFRRLELMDAASYGTFWQEAQEIGLKAWLSGGRVVVNKKTWYAHLHKGRQFGRGYHLDERELRKGTAFTNRWFKEPRVWHKQTRPLSWLVEHFWPVPSWPENWREALPCG